MSVIKFFILLLLVTLAVFTFINWTAFMEPASLSVIFTTIHAPLGVIVLVAMTLVIAAVLAYTVYLQTSAMLAARRHARDLKAQRHLAEQSEASRLTELRAILETRMDRLDSEIAASESRIQLRFGELGEELHATVEQAGNTLAAYIGEVEDRLERAIAPTAPH